MSQEQENDDETNTSDPEHRIVALYGDIDEENTRDVLGRLLQYYYDASEGAEPVDFFISTGGGNLAEMFSIYDMIRMVRDKCPVHPIGIGKVMSAGVLLLASGTKGQRRIGKHCRIMLHHVLTEGHGSVASIGDTYKEANYQEELWFEALAGETNLTVKQLRRIVSKNSDTFFNAEEAVKMGIADIII